MEYARTLAIADHHARGHPGSKALVAGIRHGLRQIQACAPQLPISRRRFARARRIVEQLPALPIPGILGLGGGITEENRFEKGFVMSKMKVEGSFVALITPFNQDGTTDFGAFRTLLKFQENHGTGAVLIMGSTGEVSMLSQQERQAIIVETAKMKTGRMKFFYGCTGNNTETTKDYLRFAKANGADGAILAAPSYICGLESDIEDYFLEVADATDLPLGLYNNPPRVKTDLHWDNLIRIFKHPNYVVHKESTTRVGQVAQVLRANTDVAVMCCDSPNLGLLVPTMSLGGHGTANMTGNIAPSEMAALSTPWTTPDISVSFRATYLHILSLLHFSYSAINPVAIKSLMKAVGLPAGELRKPLKGLEGEALLKGLRIIKELGLDEKYGWRSAALQSC
nr:dihydrodipicolinate synthase family protein [Verminephrobacter eiseniae]